MATNFTNIPVLKDTGETNTDVTTAWGIEPATTE